MKPATAGLPAVLRQLRTFRGRSARSVAKAMGIPLRTYQLFESGHQRLQVDLIFRFAEALEADPCAVLLGVILDMPGLGRLLRRQQAHHRPATGAEGLPRGDRTFHLQPAHHAPSAVIPRHVR